MLTRREFVAGLGAGVVAGAVGKAAGQTAPTTPAAMPATRPIVVPKITIPRWRGFNLLERFSTEWMGKEPFQEKDFEVMREWGFDFVRIPMDYRFWGNPENYTEIREAGLTPIDAVVELGRKHGVHVCLNFHRTPGYCVNPPKETKDLWKDEEAVIGSAHHWGAFAKRYAGRPNSELSFNLFNEPSHIPEVDYVRVCTKMVEAIRTQDKERLVMVDGLDYGGTPVEGLLELGVVQSTRGYTPFMLSHYKAGWVKGSDTWGAPTWPSADGWNAARLKSERIDPFVRIEAKGSRVIVGEFGAFNKTPHDVVLPWLKDSVSLWKAQGWGWAMWNFRGAFGVADSERTDVKYEDYKGLKVDRAMLEVLQAG